MYFSGILDAIHFNINNCWLRTNNDDVYRECGVLHPRIMSRVSPAPALGDRIRHSAPGSGSDNTMSFRLRGSERETYLEYTYLRIYVKCE